MKNYLKNILILFVIFYSIERKNKGIIWKSDNSKIVSVDKGKIFCHNHGKAIISANSANGKKSQCVVTVLSINIDLPIIEFTIKYL